MIGNVCPARPIRALPTVDTGETRTRIQSQPHEPVEGLTTAIGVFTGRPVAPGWHGPSIELQVCRHCGAVYADVRSRS